MSIQAFHLVVHGRVQGVWYRASAQTKASELNLTGWVRNCQDGTVEIHAEGDQENLDLFVEWCRKGPPSADVTRLDATSVIPEGMKTFSVR